MSKKFLLPFSVLLLMAAMPGPGNAGPTITNYNAWPNEVGQSRSYQTTQTESDWRRARAQVPTRAAPTVRTGPIPCRFIGGARAPITC